MKYNALSGYKLIWIWIYGIAMAYIESAIVVYLRIIYYPDGFSFPLKIIPVSMAMVEIGREAMTMVMLLAISLLVGRNFRQRISLFMMSFGIWDIFYYVWLKIFLNWPPSLFSWDILYLIPVPWTGPVLAPVLVSLVLILAAFLILSLDRKNLHFALTKLEWILIGSAVFTIFVSFIFDFQNIVHRGMPAPFRWDIFWVDLFRVLLYFFAAII